MRLFLLLLCATLYAQEAVENVEGDEIVKQDEVEQKEEESEDGIVRQGLKTELLKGPFSWFIPDRFQSLT